MQERNIEQLFSDDGIKYRIPIYQRRYVWGENNWRHLWTDIEENAKNGEEAREHFTGVIVTRDEEGALEIVDGQQRLTTFQIILCAIRSIFRDGDDNESADEVNDLIKNRSESALNPDEQYKLLPIAETDRKAFLALVAERIDDSYGLLHDAYVYFTDQITTYLAENEDTMVDLYRRFVDNFHVVELKLNRTDEAAKIFESLNGRGRALAQFDHLRNNMFLRAGDDRNDLYVKHWSHFNGDDWDRSDESDKIGDLFLENFLKAKLGKDFDDKLNLFDLYQRSYHKVLREQPDLDEDRPDFIKREFEELDKYSRVYAEIANCSDPENPIWFYQFLATKFETTSWHPLILLLKSEQANLGISDEHLELTFDILESYIVRCMLCHGPKSTSGENHLVSLIREPDFSIEKIVTHLKENRRIKSWPADKQVESALHKAGRRNAELIKYILFKIEREVMTESDYVDNRLSDLENLDREHVMPQGWEESQDDSGTKWWPLPKNDYDRKARERDNSLHSIGNLTLLHCKANAERAKDYAFSKKKEVYQGHSTLKITEEIRESPDWEVDQIRERACQMHKRFCQVWRSADDISRELGSNNTESSSKLDTKIQAKTDQRKELHQGTVTWVHQSGRFGRIKPDQDLHALGNYKNAIHVHIDNCLKSVSLRKDRRVKFGIDKTPGQNNIQAINVEDISDEK